MKKLIFLFLVCIPLLNSCEKNNDDNEGLFPAGEGVFVLNEGNFMAGNGSVSFYSLDKSSLHNDLFTRKNDRALGDVPVHMTADGTRGFIVVNNSGTIEVVDLYTMESLGTITGLPSPRQIVIYKRKAYVSSLSSQSLTVIDIDNLTVTGSINLGATSESMVISGKKLFAANWSGGHSVKVVDLESEQVTATLETGLEPESMALDAGGKLWVLCTGGYMNEEIPALYRINATTLEREVVMTFRTVSDNPSSLVMNGRGDTLYYLDEGVRRMPVSSASLPASPFITAGGRLFYKLALAPSGGMIFVTDAIDYQQKGELLIYTGKGVMTDGGVTGIIPGFMMFRAVYSQFD